MAESALEIIFSMISLMITETIGTKSKLFGLFIDLLKSMNFSTAGGTVGLLVSAALIGIVGYFFAKFVFHVGKQIIMFSVLAIVVLWVILLNII